jgi:hypothetical protein
MLGFSALAESTIADDAAVEAPSSANQNTNNFAFMLSGPIGALLVGGSRDATINLDPDLNFPPAPSSGNTYISSSNVEYIFTGSKWKVFAKKYNYQGSAPANIANATQLDLSGGNFFDVALTEATTFTFANPPATGFAQKFQVRLNVSGTVNSITWPASVVWETGSAPTLPELGQTDILEFYTSDSGTTHYGKLKEDNVS